MVRKEFKHVVALFVAQAFDVGHPFRVDVERFGASGLFISIQPLIQKQSSAHRVYGHQRVQRLDLVTSGSSSDTSCLSGHNGRRVDCFQTTNKFLHLWAKSIVRLDQRPDKSIAARRCIMLHAAEEGDPWWLSLLGLVDVPDGVGESVGPPMFLMSRCQS